MPGYEPCRFLETSSKKDSLCSICEYIMKNPVQCSKCNFICCQECKNKGPITCEHSFSANSTLRSKIEELSIKCKNWTKGCMEIQKIKSIQSHEDSQCYYKQAVCGRKECEEISFPGKIKHIPECGFFLIICEACKKELKQSDKETHKCIDWLNAVVQNIETKTSILRAENIELAKKNKTLKEVLSIKGPELNRQIFESKDRNGFLTKEIETFKVNMQKEIQCLEDKGIDKMKIFHENAETRLKSLWNRSQFDYEQLSKRLNDHLKTYSDNVTGLLADFSNKIENDESNFDNKPKENGEKVKINGNGNVVNHGGIGQSPTNKTARNQGSGKKNNKNPIAVKK